jgi:hypothetical protein
MLYNPKIKYSNIVETGENAPFTVVRFWRIYFLLVAIFLFYRPGFSPGAGNRVQNIRFRLCTEPAWIASRSLLTALDELTAHVLHNSDLVVNPTFFCWEESFERSVSIPATA